MLDWLGCLNMDGPERSNLSNVSSIYIPAVVDLPFKLRVQFPDSQKVAI